MRLNRQLTSHLSLAIVLVGPLFLMSPANPLSAPADEAVCPATFSSTTLPCCADGQGGFATCIVTMEVTPTSLPDCAPCSFEYDVTVDCTSCGTINVAGESGIVCASREGHSIPCPDGVGDAVKLQFLCGYCEVEPGEN